MKLSKFNRALDSLIAISAAVLIIFIPLYPKFPTLPVPGTYVEIRLEDFLVTFALLVTITRIVTGKRKELANRISRAIFLYWAVGFLSLCSAIFITKLVVPHIAVLHYLRRIEYMGLFFVGMLAIRRKHDIKILSGIFFITLFLIFVYGIGQKFFGFPVISTMNEEFSKGMLLKLDTWTRISATFSGHYDLAAFSSIALPLILAAIFIIRRKLWRIILVLLYASSYYLLILTASRVSFVAYLLAISALLVFLHKKAWIIPILGISILGSLFSENINQRFTITIKTGFPRLAERLEHAFPSGAQVFLPPMSPSLATPTPSPTPTPTSAVASLREQKNTTSPQLTKNETSLNKTAAASLSARRAKEKEEAFWNEQKSVEMGIQRSGGIRFDAEWPRAWRHFKKNPLLGTGYSSITLATDNDYLRALGETGILGLLSFLLIFLEEAIFITDFLKNHRLEKWQKSIMIAAAAATLAILANAVFIDVFEASKVAFTFWLLLGIMVGMVKKRNGSLYSPKL